MTKKQATIISVLVIIAVALGILVSRRLWFRLDLTKGKTYTISTVSRNLHNEIPDQVRITYYLSDKLKAIHPIPGEIEDLLEEYSGYSRGKIQLVVRDPAKANLTAQVEQFGIMPQQIQTLEQDQASVITVYSGIIIEYLEKTEIMPAVFSLETLEYDLTSRIRSLVRGTTRLMGILAGENAQNWSEIYSPLINAWMQAGYQYRLIAPGQDIPDTLPALMVLGGAETFTNTDLYQIDRYIQLGGKVFFAVKGIKVETEGNLEARVAADTGLLQMLASYGITVLPEMALDRSALTMQYQTQSQTGALMLRIVRNPQWIRVLGENGNPDHPVSAGFSGLDMYWPSPLELNAPGGVQADYLFTSTDEAWSMKEPFYTNPEVPYLFERDAADSGGKKILGASLTGTFPSWFAGKPKPEQEGMPALADMPAVPKEARIIVVGDTEFASTFMNVTGGQRNLDFLVQAADWLSNDDDIVGIRSRQPGSGRLDKIIEPEKKAAAIRTAQIVNVFLVPLLVILAGVFLAVNRGTKSRGRPDENAGKDKDVEEKKEETVKELQDGV